jgi:tRNA A37 methylthiotransferase MiaB
VKHARRDKLNTLLTEISLENNQQEIWMTKTVLINEIGEDFLSGYTEDMRQIILELKAWSLKLEAKVGTFVATKITKAVPFKLYGENI